MNDNAQQTGTPGPVGELPPAQPAPAGAAPAPARSSNAKWFIIIAAVLGGLCLIGCAVVLLVLRTASSTVEQSVVSDPGEIAAKSNEVAEFRLPNGYQSESAMDFLGFTFAIFANPVDDSAIILMQMPVRQEITESTIQQFRDAMERQMDRSTSNFDVVNDYDTTIRGQPAKVIVQEGVSDENVPVRVMSVFFQGKKGLAMMYIAGPQDSWDQAAYDRMVQSIR